MNPRLFFDVAEGLGGSEAEVRTAVNRYYYAVFNHVKTMLQHQGIKFPEGAGDHLQVKDHINQLDMGGVGPHLDSLITTLYERREDADYRLDQEISPRDREFAKGEAEQIVERIGGWP